MYVSVTVKIPVKLLEQIDELVARGEYKSRGDAIRDALEEFVYKKILFPGIRTDKRDMQELSTT
ncbi:MAG: ribbon-helix-helix domain-containing protein [Fervidicoccaceae archaeon]|nr:ribbon-helix-helix domain-containing protein [Fervidicoccaceae archaeon]